MSLLSKLFGKRDAPSAAPAPASPATAFAADPLPFDPAAEAPPDPHMTEHLRQLVAMPREARDDIWQREFFATLWTAGIVIPTSEPFVGPDGFPYLRFELPVTDEFVAHNLAALARPCLDSAAGVVLFEGPEATEPAYVIPMGVIESLIRYRDWRGDPIDLEEAADAPPGNEVTVEAGTKIMTGTPSDEYLSRDSARGLDRYMKEAWGIAEPRVMVIMSPAMQPSRSLVFNARRSFFQSDDEAQDFMQRLSWYIPPSRTITLMPEDWPDAEMLTLAEYVKG